MVRFEDTVAKRLRKRHGRSGFVLAPGERQLQHVGGQSMKLRVQGFHFLVVFGESLGQRQRKKPLAEIA